MRTCNMQALRGQNAGKPVLYVDLEAGHGAIMNAVDDRMFMLRTITDLVQSSTIDPGAIEISDVCKMLHTLVNETDGLCSAAYHLALEADASSEKGSA